MDPFNTTAAEHIARLDPRDFRIARNDGFTHGLYADERGRHYAPNTWAAIELVEELGGRDAIADALTALWGDPERYYGADPISATAHWHASLEQVAA